MPVTLDAPAAWNLLKGFVCVYKPPFMSSVKMKNILLGNLTEDLNSISVRPPRPFVKIEGDTTKPLKVSVVDNYADHPLVVGPRYQIEDIGYQFPITHGYKTSGVTIMALNQSAQIFEDDHWQHCVKAYHIKGKLGLLTNNMFSDGKVIYDNVNYGFIRRDHIDKIVASFQANFQKRMFEQAGVDISSQSAYELAAKGPIRPLNLKQPVVYGMKCIEFKPPDFTLEIQCIGEYEEFLIRIIHDLGEKLRSSAVCDGIRCIRNAQFTLAHALLRKHWRLKHVLENMYQNEKIIQTMAEMKPHLQSLENNS